MNLIKYPTAIVLLLLTTLLTTSLAQQKRQTPAKPQPRPTAPPPTFDTLIPAESYMLYAEVRGVGQLIRSSTFNDFVEPILKLAGPPKELRNVVKWLNANADELMTSRLLVAAWPVAKDVPDGIIAIEFASAEEAAKFAGPLNQFLPTVLPTPVPETSHESKKKPGEAAKPGYYFQQAGSLLLLTAKPLTLRKLRPAGSKPITEDVNFRTARNRFNSEPLFLFVDVKMMEGQQDEQMTKYQAEVEKRAEQKRKEAAARGEEEKEAEAEAADVFTVTEIVTNVGPTALGQPPQPGLKEAAPDPVAIAVSSLASGFFSGESDWPDAVGLALAFENDSFDLRALLVNQPGEKSDAVPFLPKLIPGPAVLPESPNIVPADTQVLLTMSLDLPQIYAVMSKPSPPAFMVYPRRTTIPGQEVPEISPFAEIEKKLGLNIKDDLLPLLGPEIAVRLPATGLNMFGIAFPSGPFPGPEEKQNSSTDTSPVLFLSIKDKEAVRTIMPKLIDSLGFKGASSFAQTERKEDTEIVSYVNLFAYAFVGNFLVLSADPAAIRHVVDSYLKHETLAGDAHFRAYTRWQPRPAQGQLYISPALMESYKTWAESSSTHVSEQTRAFLTRLSAVSQPITYSLSNDGFGPFHELHLPKNLVLMAVAGISGEVNPPPMLANEKKAISVLYMISSAQFQYKSGKGNGNFGTLEQLIAGQLVSKEFMEGSSYKFDMSVSADKFEISAVPVEYGKTGIRSFLIDQTFTLRGGDRNGAPVSTSDPRISN